jgi:hypothetical protein
MAVSITYNYSLYLFLKKKHRDKEISMKEKPYVKIFILIFVGA